MEAELSMTDPSMLPLAARLPSQLPRLRSLVGQLLGGSGGADVDDLVQEVVARALQYGQGFDARRPLWPWLRSTAVRVVIDHRASAGRRPRALSKELLDGPDASHERALAAAVGAEAVADLLAPLAQLERQLLLRFHRDGRSIAELARELGLPEGTVKSHLYRARRRLVQLQQLREQGGGA